jgi:hypothetical protein
VPVKLNIEIKVRQGASIAQAFPDGVQGKKDAFWVETIAKPGDSACRSANAGESLKVKGCFNCVDIFPWNIYFLALPANNNIVKTPP